jgi:hypothetical protein
MEVLGLCEWGETAFIPQSGAGRWRASTAASETPGVRDFDVCRAFAVSMQCGKTCNDGGMT